MARARIEQVNWGLRDDSLAITASGNYFVFDPSGSVTLDFAGTEGDKFQIIRDGNNLFSVQDDGTVSISGSLTVGGTFYATASYALTASTALDAIITASLVGGDLVFTKGDGSSFSLPISGGGYVDVSTYLSSSWTSSYYEDSASVASQIRDLYTGSLTTGSFETASYAITASYAETASIQYSTSSGENFSLSQIQVNDYDDNVSVNFVNGKLTFTFGSPALPSPVTASLVGFLTDRFNQVTDNYTVNGIWNNGGYTLISASLYEGSTLLTEVGVGTSIAYNTTTSGSHTYTFKYTASSPLDNSLHTGSVTTTGTLSKVQPAVPTITPTPSVQLGATSNQIEQGATGSISFIAAYGAANSWEQVSLVTNPISSPIQVTGSATGSTSISITATSNYQSPAGTNSPQLTTNTSATSTYTKIRSLRAGAATQTSFTQSELENLALWSTTLGGTIGNIYKGTTTASGQSVTITWTGDKYHYIVFDSARSNLTNIVTSGFGVLSQFTLTTVGTYKIYKTTTLQAGGAGKTITYTLT